MTNASTPTITSAPISRIRARCRPRSPRPVMPGSWAAIIPPSRRRTLELLRVLHRPRPPDPRALGLSRIRELLLDLAHDVAGQPGRGEVVDLRGPEEDPCLTAGQDRERALHALERIGDRLEILE